MDEGVGRKNKWEMYAERIDTSTSSKLATFELTAANTLKLMNRKTSGKLLDIGCGFGEIDILLAEKTDFQITACDISERCVQRARSNVAEAGLQTRISVERGDVYQLPYQDNCFDALTSFGYTSAATYKGAQNEVARVLKPGGFLICDFINTLSLYKFLSFLSRASQGKYYHLATRKDIQAYFGRYGLRFVSECLFNTYPPLDFLPKASMTLFEKSFGKIFHKVLGRVRLVCFQKV